ncbi:hypothetical protein PH7735_02806 [Shimia thalassica]|uniref:Sulfotransferase family protein n=1 Tax=Shimia thalassica TaxID=1715693 RepID=A0A0P1IC82_9RHOB|nr:sulfotransferase [Shimia thalassica]CUK04615.1 hypothetical protein PH7735_02806 [Shimia thalassica]
MKMINLGLPKSGTTTLQRALETSGVPSAHWAVAPVIGPANLEQLETYVGYRMYRDHFRGLDPLQGLAEFDVITQVDMVSDHYSFWPQTDLALLRSIRAHHPECTFLLLRRDPAKVAKSIVGWLDMQARLANTGAPGLPAPFAQDAEYLERWVTSHYTNLRTWFDNDPKYVEVDIASEEARDVLEDCLGQKFEWWGKANKSRKPNAARHWTL